MVGDGSGAGRPSVLSSLRRKSLARSAAQGRTIRVYLVPAVGSPTPSWPDLVFSMVGDGAAPGGPGPEQPETQYRWRRPTNDQSVSLFAVGSPTPSWPELNFPWSAAERAGRPRSEQPETRYRWRRSAARGRMIRWISFPAWDCQRVGQN
jgi:hypothetical protein